jgi:UDP-glucose 4-epimerase
VIARLFNTVGPRQTGRYGMVIPTFVRQALRGEAITVYGDGTQSRAFTYVGDAVRALLDLPTRPEAFGEVFNIGGGREITIMDLAKLVRERTGSASEIVTVPYDEAYAPGFEDMQRRVPDISKLHRVTGFEPQVDLEEIIDRVAEHGRQNPEFI